MKYSTALRDSARKRIERLGSADLLVGIPCYNNDPTIDHVVHAVEAGLSQHFPKMRSIVLISDGGSVDDSRDIANLVEVTPWVERIVMIYRGVPGKGSAVRAVFEAAEIVKSKVVLIFDADLRSIGPDWVKAMADPVMKNSYEFVAPFYKRYKYDGTITNHIVYNLTRALYGYRIRQPIGGDFACSLPLVKKYLEYDVWETDVGKFGIDIWMTTTAMVERCKVCQAPLGVKVHDVKDPAESLGPMFRQVVTTLFQLMEQNHKAWKDVTESQPVPIVGPEPNVEPKPFEISADKLLEDFQLGINHFGPLWESILGSKKFSDLKKLSAVRSASELHMDVDFWIELLFDFAITFHRWPKDKHKFVQTVTPIYFARIGSFLNEAKDLSNADAEQLIEKQAERTEALKPYLLEHWEENSVREQSAAASP